MTTDLVLLKRLLEKRKYRFEVVEGQDYPNVPMWLGSFDKPNPEYVPFKIWTLSVYDDGYTDFVFNANGRLISVRGQKD